jgi:hypothetical protein
VAAQRPSLLIAKVVLGIVRERGEAEDEMRFQGVIALAIAALVSGCGHGWLGPKGTAPSTSDVPGEISKPMGPHLVARCPVPVAYDDATSRKIQEALDALPKDSVLRKAMTDYENERDNLRMCQ